MTNIKTNAMRVLDSRKIPYQVVTYTQEKIPADEVARLVGAPAGQVFKTLVVRREKGRPLLVMIPADRELDLRALAREIDAKKVAMASQKEAETLTGLVVGGIGALALLNKGFDIYLDRTAEAWDEIYVNGGQRGVNLRLEVDDLVKVTGAKWVSAAIESGKEESAG